MSWISTPCISQWPTSCAAIAGKLTDRRPQPRDPLVSVVMAVRNDETRAVASAESILRQSFRRLELIVVDDASEDGTVDALRTIEDGRLTLLGNARHYGQTRCLNQALRVASGDYIARQDSDDLSRKDRIAQQVHYLQQHPDTVLLGTAATVVDDLGRERGTVRRGTTDLFLRWMLQFGNPFIHSSLMWRRHPPVGTPLMYEECLEYAQDYDLVVRASGLGMLACLPKPLLVYCQHPNSKGASNRARQDAVAEAISRRQLQDHNAPGDNEQLLGMRRLACGQPQAIAPSQEFLVLRCFLEHYRRYLRHVAAAPQCELSLAVKEIREHVVSACTALAMADVRQQPGRTRHILLRTFNLSPCIGTRVIANCLRHVLAVTSRRFPSVRGIRVR